jgi:hypothetical protein
MFELTNALIELGVPAVAQDDPALLSKSFVHREEELWRAGAPAKFERVKNSLCVEYDPETAITMHFSMLRVAARASRFGVFPSLTPREVVYTTGNHTVTPAGLRRLAGAFEKILAPSQHVLGPYLAAGLSHACGAVIPHGIDPGVFSPEAPPLAYGTDKRFRFLQTSFPWVYEKGFDITIRAFLACRPREGLESPEEIVFYDLPQHVTRLQLWVGLVRQAHRPGAVVARAVAARRRADPYQRGWRCA